jgi:hypothetical protein
MKTLCNELSGVRAVLIEEAKAKAKRGSVGKEISGYASDVKLDGRLKAIGPLESEAPGSNRTFVRIHFWFRRSRVLSHRS